MQPLNPFLRAFFASKLPAQCYPPGQHVLLVPPTDLLLTNKDHDTQVDFFQLVKNEEFLSSHIIRVAGNPAPTTNGRESGGLRDSKGKARQYATLDGKTVVIKDVFVYSNKGFKTLTQAQILQDEVYYTNALETQQWLIYHISRPLLGTPEPLIYPASVLDPELDVAQTVKSAKPGSSLTPVKQDDVKTFDALLGNFPMIARQMQPALEKLFQQFKQDVEKPLPDIPGLNNGNSILIDSYSHLSTTSDANVLLTPTITNKSVISNTSTFIARQTHLRQCTENLVTTAIDIFQNVDKQQLSILAAATNLAGPAVERMIERYMIEQVHDKFLFQQIRLVTLQEDEDLSKAIKKMSDIDISQVGIAEEDGMLFRKELARRVLAGSEAFKGMSLASSPQESIEILLETEKLVTSSTISNSAEPSTTTRTSEKANFVSTNADTLVSLLLMVVIRSPVQHLHARLAYMRDFSFMNDVESGETGYALSTYEAVLSYISSNAKGLKVISHANRTLWRAVKSGDISAVRSSLCLTDQTQNLDGDLAVDSETSVGNDSTTFDDRFATIGNGYVKHQPLKSFIEMESDSTHVYPRSNVTSQTNDDKPKAKKRVSMDTRSVSSSSTHSWHSRVSAGDSNGTAIIGDIVPAQLCQTEDSNGNSILMMAIEHGQAETLKFLLCLTDLISPDVVFQTCNNDGTSLLSAAVQMGNNIVIDVLLRYLLENARTQAKIVDYLKIQDNKGRTVAHHLFNASHLIETFRGMLPWRMKDKNGQTPLFAMFRCYDHEAYHRLVDSAMAAAAAAQGDMEHLHLDDHVDGKSNTLLHIVNDPRIIRTLLYQCDSDPNSYNDRRFTPLMVASKFARIDLVRMFFGDERVDLQARDLRGLTAVELAKDDEIRNRIDDMLLLSTMPAHESRRTIIVRSFFVDDGTIRLVIKSGARNPNSTITVTTCRRSLTDFENLVQWLALEHPASWLPSILRLRSPFQIPSKPSRQMLRDIQLRLDSFLQTLLAHPTFSTHEMLWEFILVPDIDPGMLAERARRKSQARIERLQEEYQPIIDGTSEVVSFVNHARDQTFDVHRAFKGFFQNLNDIRNASSDLAMASQIVSQHLSALPFLNRNSKISMTRYSGTLAQAEFSPNVQLHHALLSNLSVTSALLSALSRPTQLIRSINQTRESLGKLEASASRSSRWPSALGLLDETRSRREHDSTERAEKAKQELRRLGCELRYTQQTVAGELAGWQEGHAETLQGSLRDWARRSLVAEKGRLQGMKRALRCLAMSKTSK